jgi:hypothetical protein
MTLLALQAALALQAELALLTNSTNPTGLIEE